jgi:hypothetical protein
MNKLKLCLAASIAALALYSCGGEGAAMLTPVGPNDTPPDGTDKTDIIITFENGWEDVSQSFTKENDDPYTDYTYFKPLTPAKTNAVVDSAELTAYKDAHAEWQKLKDAWDEYEKNNDSAQSGETIVPPPPLRKNLFIL